jgi:hypothetical protein
MISFDIKVVYGVIDKDLLWVRVRRTGKGCALTCMPLAPSERWALNIKWRKPFRPFIKLPFGWRITYLFPIECRFDKYYLRNRRVT